MSQPTQARSRPGLDTVLLTAAFACLVALPAGCGAPPQDASARQSLPEAQGAAPTDAEGKKILPEIPRDNLPPLTRRKPDPERDRYERDPVFVWVEETVTPMDGKAYTPPTNVTLSYLKAYLRRAGRRSAEKPESSALRIEGTVKASFDSELTAMNRKVGWKYRGQASFRVLDSAGNDKGSFEIPELFQANAKSEESAALNLRRHLAKVIWDHLTERDTGLVSHKAQALIGSVTEETAEAPAGKDTAAAPATAEAVVRELADIGLDAVPCLLEALTDERPVQMASSYPGQKEMPGALKVYHIADKALEEIFQKVSRLGLGTDFAGRMLVTKGWEKEWARFCPPFAEHLEEQKKEAPGK